MNSQNEPVDILDHNLTRINTVTKSLAHIKGLLHPVIISEVINSKGEWLLVRQASDRQDASQLVSPIGGHVQTHESELDALVREAGEELGLVVNINQPATFKRVGQAIFDRKVLGRHENHLFILYEIYSDIDPVLNYESVEFRRFSTQQLNILIKQKPTLFGAAFHFVWNTFYQNKER